MELIDRAKLLTMLDNIKHGDLSIYMKETIEAFAKAVEALPAIDPVHAAGGCYCEECVFYKQDPLEMTGLMVCTVSQKNLPPRMYDDFCDYGVRKEIYNA